MQELESPNGSPTRAHIETRLLYARLKALQPGETVSYEDLSREIGKDVHRGSWHFLTTALSWLEREDRIVTECDPGTGVRRVTNEEHTAVMQLHRKRAQGQLRRGIDKAACADYERLPDQSRREFNRELAHLGVLHAMSGEKAAKAIAQASDGKRISSSEAMQALLGTE